LRKFSESGVRSITALQGYIKRAYEGRAVAIAMSALLENKKLRCR
jgi:hypothetical protein